jgi:HEPN domain-containing protein
MVGYRYSDEAFHSNFFHSAFLFLEQMHTEMRAELWLNRADHDLSVSQDLLKNGSLIWAVSYALRSAEYALEGLIVLKTGERPEKGLSLAELYPLTRDYYPETVCSAVTDLMQVSSLAWKSDLTPQQVSAITPEQAEKLCSGAEFILSWIGEEWEASVQTEEAENSKNELGSSQPSGGKN